MPFFYFTFVESHHFLFVVILHNDLAIFLLPSFFHFHTSTWNNFEIFYAVLLFDLFSGLSSEDCCHPLSPSPLEWYNYLFSIKCMRKMNYNESLSLWLFFYRDHCLACSNLFSAVSDASLFYTLLCFCIPVSTLLTLCCICACVPFLV